MTILRFHTPLIEPDLRGAGVGNHPGLPGPMPTRFRPALNNLRAAISVDAMNHVAVIVEAGPGHFDDESDSGRPWIALAMVTSSPRVTTRSGSGRLAASQTNVRQDV